MSNTPKSAPKVMPWSNAIVTFCKLKGKDDTTKGAKELRGIVRANYGKDTPKGKAATAIVTRAKKENRDNNRYVGATDAELRALAGK